MSHHKVFHLFIVSIFAFFIISLTSVSAKTTTITACVDEIEFEKDAQGIPRIYFYLEDYELAKHQIFKGEKEKFLVDIPSEERCRNQDCSEQAQSMRWLIKVLADFLSETKSFEGTPLQITVDLQKKTISDILYQP